MGIAAAQCTEATLFSVLVMSLDTWMDWFFYEALCIDMCHKMSAVCSLECTNLSIGFRFIFSPSQCHKKHSEFFYLEIFVNFCQSLSRLLICQSMLIFVNQCRLWNLLSISPTLLNFWYKDSSRKRNEDLKTNKMLTFGKR